jgi:nucleotide-binding universal stress UspA family protein
MLVAVDDEVDDSQLTPATFRHVVLPLDGSALALAALPTATSLAKRFGAHLSTISVATGDDEAERLRREVSDALGTDRRDVEVVAVTASDVAGTIVQRLAELDDPVLCMSTHGRGRVTGALIGSVARSVLETAQVPVVAVGPVADRPGHLVGRPPRRPAGWAEPLSVGGIVACVDGSKAAEAAVPVAATWAIALDRPLTILTVADDSPTDTSGPRHNSLGPTDPQSYVDELARQLAHRLPSCTGHVVYDPIGVASGMRSFLNANPVALVALCSATRSGLNRIRLGSTTADIVRISTVPALVVPLATP